MPESMSSPRAFLIAGPTASGKTALALEVAERVGGAVVNADSMQVYRDFHILTARPTPQEEARAPHFLFGHVDAGVNYSVGRWLADFAATLAELDARGLTPVVVGGTGMYFKAALYGLSDIPAVPDASIAAVRAAAQGYVTGGAGDFGVEGSVAREAAALRLTGLHVMTTLTGSALLALAVAHGFRNAQAAWAAAHVDEDFQMRAWGQDAEAMARRERRWLEMQAAAVVGA